MVFGGHGAQPEDDEVWALCQDAKWARLEPRSAGPGRTPCARSGHTAAWVSGIGLVVFGGLSHEKGRYLSDCHLLQEDADKGFGWTALGVSGTELPCARDKHSAVELP